MSDYPEAPAPQTSHGLVKDIKKPRIPAKPFLPGNPGRPKGAKNHSTRLREILLSQVGRAAIARFKRRLNKPSSPRDFDKALDQVICLLGPSKPTALIDNSKHTHFTVVLDEQPKQ